MTAFPLTRAWFAERTPLEPGLMEGYSFDQLIGQRIRELRLAGDAEFAASLRADRVEAARAYTMIAVPETWLFRGHSSFETLRDWLIERRAHGLSRIRMLSAGCATGAEPWSLAITAAAAGFAPRSVTIDAVDLNPDVVQAVSAGRFGRMAVRDYVPDWAQPHLRRESGELVADAALSSCIRVTNGDLFEWTPAEPYSVVFCRNVLIYLSRPARMRLAERLMSWLTPDGILCTGHADGAFDLVRALRAFGHPSAFMYRWPDEPRERTPEPQNAPRREPVPEPRPSAGGRPSQERRSATRRRRERPAGDRTHERAEPAPPAETRVDHLSDLGDARLREGNLAEADDAFRRIIYFEPKHEYALIRLAEIADRLGKGELAARYRARAIDSHLEHEILSRPPESEERT